MKPVLKSQKQLPSSSRANDAAINQGLPQASRCARAVLFALSSAASLVASSAMAQTNQPAAPVPATAPASAQKIEKIEVTGSSIKRIEGEAALPVQVITRDEIDRGGSTTAAELLTKPILGSTTKSDVTAAL